MTRDELGFAVWVLCHKLWGKIQFDGRLRSQDWWERRKQSLINHPTIQIAAENLWECGSTEPTPVSLEIEFGMPDLDYEMLLKAWKKTGLGA